MGAKGRRGLLQACGAGEYQARHSTARELEQVSCSCHTTCHDQVQVQPVQPRTSVAYCVGALDLLKGSTSHPLTSFRAPFPSPPLLRTKLKCRLETPDGQWVERIPAWIKWATQEWNEIQYNGVNWEGGEHNRNSEASPFSDSCTLEGRRLQQNAGNTVPPLARQAM